MVKSYTPIVYWFYNQDLLRIIYLVMVNMAPALFPFFFYQVKPLFTNMSLELESTWVQSCFLPFSFNNIIVCSYCSYTMPSLNYCGLERYRVSWHCKRWSFLLQQHNVCSCCSYTMPSLNYCGLERYRVSWHCKKWGMINYPSMAFTSSVNE